MKKNTIHEGLKEYLKNTPKEKVLEDWNQFQHLDDEGITVKEFLENQKQTELEEVAERIALETYKETFSKYPKGGKISNETLIEVLKTFFRLGSEWQQKQTYSEEEILSFGKSCFYKGFEKSEKDDANCYTAFREEIGKLFKQFKKNKS